MRVVRVLSLAVFVFACGGTGCGSRVTVTCDHSSLTFVGFTRALPSSQDISCTAVDGQGTLYGQIVLDAPVFAASFSAASPTTGVVTLTPLASSGGSRSGSITLRLCWDSACKDVAWSKAISYDLTVFAIDNSGVELSGYERLDGGSGTLTISPPDVQQQLIVHASEAEGSGWLTASRESGTTIRVGADSAGLGAGSYHGTVSVAFAGQAATPRLDVPVTFAVASGLVGLPLASVALTRASTADTLRGTAPVTFHGGLSRSWTATSDQPWLTLTTGSGAAPGSLAYAIDVTRLQDLPNWSSALGQISIHSPGLTDIVFPVIVRKELPEIYTVSPSAVAAGSATTVRVTGRGLLQLTGADQIDVGGSSASDGAIVDDRHATLHLPALTPGGKTVSVPNGLGIAAWSGSLAVATRSSLTYATVANAGEKRSAVFDPGRNALFAINRTQGTLVRFRLNGTEWQVDTATVSNIADLASSPDRSRLYVGSGVNQLVEIDPDLMAVTATHTVPDKGGIASLATGRWVSTGMAVTSDLRIWFGDTQWSAMSYFDLRRATFGNATGYNQLYSPTFYAAGDGSSLLVSQSILSPPLSNYVYSSDTGNLSSPAGVPLVYSHAFLDEDGGKALVDDASLYRMSDFALLGKVPPPPNAIGMTALLSPGGTRIYKLVTKGTSTLVVDHVDVYDATRLQPGTSALVKIGEIPVTDQAGACGWNASDCTVAGAFVLSPLGDTLFWIGNQRLVVLPIPAAFSE